MAPRTTLSSISSSSPSALVVSSRCLRRSGHRLSFTREMWDDEVGEHLLGLDRLPVLESAWVDRDRDLGQPLADLARVLDAGDHVVRRPHPHDVAGDHLVIRGGRKLLHDPRGVEAVAGLVQFLVRGAFGQRRGVALEEATHSLLGVAPGDLAVLVHVAGVDPDDVGFVAVPAAALAVDVELLLERLVGQQRRHGDRVALAPGQLVGVVAGTPDEDLEPAAWWTRLDVRVIDVVEAPVVGEALVLERLEQQLERLVVELPDVLQPYPGLWRDPAVATPDPELVAPAEQDLGL